MKHCYIIKWEYTETSPHKNNWITSYIKFGQSKDDFILEAMKCDRYTNYIYETPEGEELEINGLAENNLEIWDGETLPVSLDCGDYVLSLEEF